MCKGRRYANKLIKTSYSTYVAGNTEGTGLRIERTINSMEVEFEELGLCLAQAVAPRTVNLQFVVGLMSRRRNLLMSSRNIELDVMAWQTTVYRLLKQARWARRVWRNRRRQRGISKYFWGRNLYYTFMLQRNLKQYLEIENKQGWFRHIDNLVSDAVAGWPSGENLKAVSDEEWFENVVELLYERVKDLMELRALGAHHCRECATMPTGLYVSSLIDEMRRQCKNGVGWLLLKAVEAYAVPISKTYWFEQSIDRHQAAAFFSKVAVLAENSSWLYLQNTMSEQAMVVWRLTIRFQLVGKRKTVFRSSLNEPKETRIRNDLVRQRRLNRIREIMYKRVKSFLLNLRNLIKFAEPVFRSIVFLSSLSTATLENLFLHQNRKGAVEHLKEGFLHLRQLKRASIWPKRLKLKRKRRKGLKRLRKSPTRGMPVRIRKSIKTPVKKKRPAVKMRRFRRNRDRRKVSRKVKRAKSQKALLSIGVFVQQRKFLSRWHRWMYRS